MRIVFPNIAKEKESNRRSENINRDCIINLYERVRFKEITKRNAVGNRLNS